MKDNLVQNKDQKGWSLDKKDWEVLNETLSSLGLDWQSLPLRKSLKELLPEQRGVYMIVGTSPIEIPGDYFNFRTPLYVGISNCNLRSRYLSHCGGELSGVESLINTWNPDNLEFVFATVDKQIDERTVESMLYDLECEFLYTFGPVANKRKQRPSYLQNSI